MVITVHELKERLERGDEVLIIDVREPYEYDEFNIGAKNIPLSSLMANVAELQDLSDTEIVLHCRSGSRSSMAQQFLLMNGFTQVYNLTGGIMAWENAFGRD